ncbi:hypothetical protein FB565_000527 [Actinoplanes lutulentus]|uniref:WD40 repeat protein n=1 Tax=Actinoplanes lutulentus TaxID=1287878 RepID=A0A327ZKE3_9ACTN|nr:hypothetical protein [Actinoplanes lutulentus]MBB2940823.1 hypothetical protein [Actinoplanes lutulentus]RAK43133.1 hypothetical protein B0I29_101263 [Actinoplanes lutulentus]
MVFPAVVLAALIGAAPLAVPPVAAVRAPGELCEITDDRLNEISGLLTDGDGYVVVNDGADDPDGRRIFFLNRKCKVVRTVKYPSRPRDTEDLARGPDQTVWVGDIGDNSGSRETIGLWRLSPGAKSPKLFRLSYPDGAHDAEALLISGDGTPVVITKDPVTAGIYVPDGELRSGKTTPLRRAGDFGIPVTSTSNPFGFPGRLVITGAAVNADRTRAVLRTYSDAFECDVTKGDVVAALTGCSSRTVALPDEPQGESIAYSADGSALLTVSEGKDAPIRSYPLTGQPGDAPQGESTSPAEATTPAETRPPTEATQSDVTQGETSSAETRAVSRELPFGAIAAAAFMIIAGAALGLLIARRRRS